MKFSRDTILTILGVIAVAVFGVAAFWAIDRYTGELAGNGSLTGANGTSGASSTRGAFTRGANFTPPANFTPGAGFGRGANGTPQADFTPPADFTPGAGFSRRATRTETPAEATATPVPTQAPTDTPTPTATETPQPTATSQQTFKLVSLTSPVVGGNYATAKVVTSPGLNCTLIYMDPTGKVYSPAGTGTVQADTNGICTWNWQIKQQTPQGNGTVTITVNLYSLSFPIAIK